MDEIKAFLEEPTSGSAAYPVIFEAEEEKPLKQIAKEFIMQHCNLTLKDVTPLNAFGNDTITSLVGTPLGVYVPNRKGYTKKNLQEIMSLTYFAARVGVDISFYFYSQSGWNKLDVL